MTISVGRGPRWVGRWLAATWLGVLLAAGWRRAAPHLRPLGELRFAVRLALALDALWWSISLGRPDQRFGAAAGYRVMAALLDEEWWAAGFAAEAALCLAALRWEALQTAAGLVAAFSQGLVAACFWLASPWGTGTGTHWLVAYLAYLVLWQHAARRVPRA